MKEFEKPVPLKEEINITAQKQQEKQLKLVGRMRPQPGQKVFEINCSTGECEEAQFEKVAVNFETAAKGDLSPRKKIMARENCVYVVALNKANAIRKFFGRLQAPTKHSSKSKK